MKTISLITSSKLSGLTVVQLRSLYVKATNIMLTTGHWAGKAKYPIFPALVLLYQASEETSREEFLSLTGFDNWISFSGAYDMAKLRCDFEGIS